MAEQPLVLAEIKDDVNILLLGIIYETRNNKILRFFHRAIAVKPLPPDSYIHKEDSTQLSRESSTLLQRETDISGENLRVGLGSEGELLVPLSVGSNI